jgi:hypothetical protein
MNRTFAPLFSVFFGSALFVAILLSTGGICAEEKSTGPAAVPPFREIQSPTALKTIAEVTARVSSLRGLVCKTPLKSGYLDSALLKNLIEKSFEKSLPPAERIGFEQFLKSLEVIPQDLDLIQMIQSLLDEQVGGLYDPESKRLFVREGFDIEGSALARAILAHEICHALQDQTYDLRKMGIESPDNDDLALSVSTIAEGDAMLLLGEYVVAHEVGGFLRDLPQALLMDQSALNNAPHFFRQQLLFPYIQGQAFVQMAVNRGKDGRSRLFTDPPRSTEEVLHSEKYFGTREAPAPLALLDKEGKIAEGALKPGIPPAPDGFERLRVNTLGEFGIRALLEDRLGAGVASEAAAGWGNDAYAVYGRDQKAWWFCWETAWDTGRDAAEFQGALVTYWRSVAGQRDLGDLRASSQTFSAKGWKVRIERVDKRLLMVWGKD